MAVPPCGEQLKVTNPGEQTGEPGQHRDCTFAPMIHLVSRFTVSVCTKLDQLANALMEQSRTCHTTLHQHLSWLPLNWNAQPAQGGASLRYPLSRFNLRADQEGTVWRRPTTPTKGEKRHKPMCLGDRIVYMVGDHTVNNSSAGLGCLTSHHNWRSGTVYSIGLTSANWFPDGRINSFWTIATTD